jgi:hypothetical protein
MFLMSVIDVPLAQTIPSERFPLSWRWTQPSHAVFAAEELASMRAIDSAASDSLRRLLRRRGITRPLQTGVVLHERALDAANLTDPEVRRWLADLPVSPAERVWLCYEWSDALELPWSLFVARWSDFCYPSSDDLVVVPGSGAWVLEYWHYETLVWFPVPGAADDGAPAGPSPPPAPPR